MNETGIGNPAISGIFIDDTWTAAGPTEEEAHAVMDTGMSKASVSAMMEAYAGNLEAVQAKVIETNAMNWQLMNNSAPLTGPPFGAGVLLRSLHAGSGLRPELHSGRRPAVLRL